MNKIIYPLIFLFVSTLCIGAVYIQCLCIENTLLELNRMTQALSSPYLAWLDKENKKQAQEVLRVEQLRQFEEYLEENQEGINLVEIIKPNNKLSIPPSRYYKERMTYIEDNIKEEENNEEPGIAGHQRYRTHYSWQQHSWISGL